MTVDAGSVGAKWSYPPPMRIKVALVLGWLFAASHAAAQPRTPAEPRADSVIDLDGDGRRDRVYNDPARVIRQTASGPQEEELRLESAENNSHITSQFTLDRLPALVVMASGHEVDHDTPGRPRSYTWGSVGVFQFAVGAPARRVWEFRSEFNQGDDPEDWRFAPQPDGSILATSTLGDDGVRGAAVSTLLVRNRQGVFEPTTCWQTSPLAAPEPPCETTLGAGGRLRVTERTRPGPNAGSVRAGSRVTVLRRGTVRRGVATLSCVRVHGSVEGPGWAFVTDAERARCTPVRR